MSVEALVVTAIVQEGAQGLRKVYQEGISSDDFLVYEEEFAWIEERVASRQPLNGRIFKGKFDEFEWLPPNENLKDLLAELKKERAFTELTQLVNTLADELDIDNALSKAEFARDRVAEITRLHAPASDHLLIAGWRDHLEEQKHLRTLRRGGAPPGIPTGLANIDFHWDGLVPGRMIVVLGRPGEGKSYLTAQFAKEAILQHYRVLFFSPEMNRREHLCRLHTLLSADSRVKEALGLKHSFRNRALMNGMGYNMKSYSRFMKHLEENYGEIILMTNTHRRRKMSPAFIEAKIEDVRPDLVIIDPIYKLSAVRPRQSRVEELSEISDSIQDLAEAFSIPVVVTNQAHRQATGKDDAPHKDSSFNSDVPVQEADHVIGVKNKSDENLLLCRCSKSRFGADFRFESQFYPNTGVLRELTQPEGSYYNGSDDPDEDELREIVGNATRATQEVEADD
jgi:replicative DNA helicase